MGAFEAQCFRGAQCVRGLTSIATAATSTHPRTMTVTNGGALFHRLGKGGKVLPDRLRAQSLAFIVKAYAARLGLDADVFSGHSLRSSFLTSAAL
jgi:hypothetical protein